MMTGTAMMMVLMMLMTVFFALQQGICRNVAVFDCARLRRSRLLNAAA